MVRDMRWLSSLASRASPALRNLPEQAQRESSSKNKPRKVLNQTPSDNVGAPLKGNSPKPNFEPQNPNLVSISTNPISAVNNKFRVDNKRIDHLYIAQILSRKDWFLLLDHELKAKRIFLNPQFVASVLQNQESPLHSLKFYIWVSSTDSLFAKNQSVRGVLAKTFYRKGPVVLSVELLEDIKNSGFKVSEDLLCILISSWGRLGLAKYCAEVFGQISFLGLSLSTRLYNAVIDALVKSNSLDLAYLKFQQMPADNCNPDRFTYNTLIHGVCKIGIVDEALRLLKQMEGLGYLPNVCTYTILIGGFCNSKRVDEAFRVLEIMKEKHVSPNEATIRSLVHGVFRCMAPSKAFELLLTFSERESVFFKVACDTILCCLSNYNMAKEIALFLKKSGARGYLPDSSTFNIIMVCLIKELANPQNEVQEIFESFIQRGVKPGFSTYLQLIEAMYKARQGDEGNRIFDQMIKEGLVSNAFSYNMVIDCFCKAKMMDRASKAFGDMQRKGIPPTLVTFNTLLNGYCKVGEVGKAHELLALLLEHGFKPDTFTFSSIIDGLCRVNQIDDAFECFAEMIRWGVTPNAITYNILIRALCFIGDIARSMRLMKRMEADGIKPDAYSFNALIQCHCRMNKVEKAEELFLAMLTLGLNPDNYTYSAFIKALCDSGKLDVAKEIFLSMEAYGCFPDSSICNIILYSLGKAIASPCVLCCSVDMFARKTCPSVAQEDDDLRNAFWNQLYPGEMESQQNSDVSTVIHRRRH
ncbi:unnamed protein product [Prunus armeniaca]|uniref:Pentacotripeptide-repeat region of PRORP domain-containing protein n=1 Tax=Prunus armeniaca TaxID=36596 RepID=A0A6J5TDU5_PRUAR|nr:unnamed protein product [Prunus armeniaca]